MKEPRDEEEQLRSVTLQNAQSIFRARQRAEEELIRTKEALWRQSEWLRVTLASIGDAVVTTDTEGKVLSLNRVAESLTGWTSQEAQGRPLVEVFQIINEETRQPVENPAERALREGRIVGLGNHTVLIARDGTATTIDDSAAPIRDEQGRVLGVVLIFRSIAERKQAERLLQVQKDTLELLVQGKPLIEVLETVARAMEEQSRHKLRAAVHLLDESGRRFAQAIAPNLPPSYGAATEGMEVETRTGPCCHAVLDRQTVIAANVADDPKWKEFGQFALPLGIRAGWSTPIMSSEQAIVGTFAIYYDEPREPSPEDAALMEVLSRTVALAIQHDQADRAKARLAAIVESSQDAIMSKDLCGVITSWNLGAERIFGYTAEEVVGQPVTMLMPPDRVAEENRILESIRRGELIETYETVRIPKDGRRIDVSLSISPVRDSTGSIIGESMISRDITARKRAEQRLATQHRITHALAESANLHEAASRILPAICDLLGWQVGALWYVDQEANALRCADLYHPPSVRVPQFEALSRQKTFEPGIGLPGRVWAEGKATWIRDVVQDDNFPRAPIANAEGLHGAFALPISLHDEILGVMEFFSDEIRQPDQDLLQMMTAVGSQIGQFIERRHVEEALRKSEERYRRLVGLLPVGVYTCDAPSGVITFYNQQAAELWGRAPCLGDTDEHFCGSYRLWRLDGEPLPHDQTPMAQAIREGRSFRNEDVVLERPNGSRINVLVNIDPVRDVAGHVVGAINAFHDTTALKQAERTTHFLADASAALAELTDYRSTLQKVAALAVPHFADWCAIDMQDADGSLQRLAVTHSDPAKVQLARELFRRYPPRPDDPHGVWNALRTGEPDWARKISDSLLAALAQDEEHLRLMQQLGLKSYICTPLRSRSRTLGVLTFVMAESGRSYDERDLTAAEDLADRAVIAIENATLLATLKETDRRKDEFLAMLAHELRNPLAPIRNAVQIFRGKGLAVPELQWATDVIDRQVHQMTRLVDDLLDVSRITRGKVELRKELVELGTLVSNAVEASRPLIEKWGHNLTVTIPPQPIRLEADATRLTQVISNLLNNAAKYTDRGGRIELSAERLPDHVLVRVRDNGIGIHPEMLPRVFDLFAQVDRSVERSDGGLGIGLTLVQRLIQMHGGDVEARSDGPGQGSEFVVRLPIGRNIPTARSGATSPEQLVPPPGRRILVVDDNRDAADSLGMLLRMMGNEVHTAHDGLEAVGAAAAFRPDAIFLDLGLPKLNGYEVARRIREQQGAESVLLVALTGWGQEEDRRRSQEAGFDHHMTKPVEFNALQKLLAAASKGRPDRGPT